MHCHARAALLLALLPVACTRLWLESESGPLEGSGPHPKHGFVTMEREGRLWVFRWGSKELKEFRDRGELAKHVTRIGAGPGGATIKAPDVDTVDAYLFGKPGFVAFNDGSGRLWVFRLYSKELQDYYVKKELAKHVTRIGAGPGGTTIKAPDGETIDEYLSTKTTPG
ncbi:MAG: hypothetical protein ACT4PV_16595 [Planctomycetaceae bacterium]